MKIEIDVKRFWEENDRCSDEFTTNKPRLRLNLEIVEDFIKSVAGGRISRGSTTTSASSRRPALKLRPS
ncbi:MAG: hypothetical protein ACUVXI_02725 [bacterium]